MVGINDACSGIRSLQSTLMISLFLGEMYRLGLLRRVVLCLAGFALAFTFNVSRTLLVVNAAATKGVAAISRWHDPAGLSIMAACLLSLWLLGLALKRLRDHGTKGPRNYGTAESCSPWSVVRGPALSRAIRRFAFVLVVWLVLVEVGAQL